MKMVWISWQDPHSTDEWTPMQDAINHQLRPVESCGFLVYEDQKRVVVCLTHDKDLDNVANYTVINRSIITDMKELKI